MSGPIVLYSATADQTARIGEAIARVAQPGDLIGLVGELGAGKTQFVRGLASGLGIDPRIVSSPTFVLMQEYEPDDRRGPVLVHVDAYRLHSEEDLASIGWESHGQPWRRDAVVVVEWADLIQAALGEDWLEIHLMHEDGGRELTLWPHGSWQSRINLLRQAVQPFEAYEA